MNSVLSSLYALDGKYFLTFDWGGGTLDITVIKIENGRMLELGTSELTGAAGDKFDEDIALIIWNRFLSKVKHKYNDEYLEKIRKSKWDRMLSIAEKCKIQLSVADNANFLMETVIPENFDDGIDEMITRRDFEELLSNTLEKACNRIDIAIKQAGINDIDIFSVLLTGGTCYIPAVQNKMKEKFGHRVETVKNAELLIAQGAAVISEMGWLPFLTKDILVELSDESYWAMFEKGMPIASEKEASISEVFTCTDKRDKNAKIIVCEGDGQTKDKNLAIINVPTLSDHRFNDDIIVEATLDKDIVLKIRAHSLFVQNYDKDKNFTTRKEAEVHQLCFGLDLGGAL